MKRAIFFDKSKIALKKLNLGEYDAISEQKKAASTESSITLIFIILPFHFSWNIWRQMDIWNWYFNDVYFHCDYALGSKDRF